MTKMNLLEEDTIITMTADWFVEAMATSLRDDFEDIIRDALYGYRDHILNAVDGDDGSPPESPTPSRNLLEGDSDSYVYAENIINKLVELCIEIQDME